MRLWFTDKGVIPVVILLAIGFTSISVAQWLPDYTKVRHYQVHRFQRDTINYLWADTIKGAKVDSSARADSLGFALGGVRIVVFSTGIAVKESLIAGVMTVVDTVDMRSWSRSVFASQTDSTKDAKRAEVTDTVRGKGQTGKVYTVGDTAILPTRVTVGVGANKNNFSVYGTGGITSGLGVGPTFGPAVAGAGYINAENGVNIGTLTSAAAGALTIGGTAAQAWLVSSDPASITGMIWRQGNAAGNGANMLIRGATGDLQFETYTSVGAVLAERMRIFNAGGVELRGSLTGGTLGDELFFSNISYPTTYRNKIQSSVSSTPALSKLVFSLCTGASTFADALTLFGTQKDSGFVAKRDTIISKWDSISTRLAAVRSVSWGGYTGAGWDSTWHRWGRRDSVDSLEAKTYFKAPYLASTGSPVMATNGEMKVNQSGLFWQGNGAEYQAMAVGGLASGTATITSGMGMFVGTACTLTNALISTNSIIPPPTLLSDPGVSVGSPYCTLSAGQAIFTWPVKFLITTNVYWILLKP